MDRAKPRICFVDDDEDSRRQWLEWAAGKGYPAEAFESAFDANGNDADIFVFDVSAVSPFAGGAFGRHAYAPVCRLMEDHPDAEIVIGSCVSRGTVEGIIADVERNSGRRPFFFDMSKGFEGLERALLAIRVQEDAR
jgi:hypothetical protein